jgi:hypothetical protein
MRTLLITTLLLSTLAAGGCGQRQVNAAEDSLKKPNGDEQRGYLCSNNSTAIFIRWTEVNKKIIGQLQVFYTKGYAEKQSQDESHSFEGMCDGENISINFTGSIWISDLSGKTWTGTLKGDELTLVVPTGTGMLAPMQFKTATVGEYNQAVATIRRGLIEYNARVKQERNDAARIETEQQAVADTNQKMEWAFGRLASAASDLQAGEDFDVVLKDYARHWAEMQIHYQEMKSKAARKQLTTFELNEVESDLRTVESDLRSIESDARSMEYRQQSLNRKIGEVKEAIALLRQSWGGLQQAMAVNASGSPGNMYTEGDVLEQVRRSEAVIEHAQTLLQKMAKQGAAFDRQASDLYKKGESLVKGLSPTDE